MGKTARLREHCKEYLERHGVCNTAEIFDFINKNTRWGTTMNQLSNVLSKTKGIVKVDYIDVSSTRGVVTTRLRVCEWMLED
jgi:hypothetical protein